jgi:predicted DNA-binding transcriptional regulator AlpA
MLLKLSTRQASLPLHVLTRRPRARPDRGFDADRRGRMAEFLTSEEVAKWLRVSPSTLCRWRQAGRGPRVTWLSASCPRYERSDVEAWLKRAVA